MKTVICAILVLTAIAAAKVYNVGLDTVSTQASAIAELNQQILQSDSGHLLDLETGLPVECDTDMDCYEKTGVNPYSQELAGQDIDLLILSQ